MNGFCFSASSAPWNAEPIPSGSAKSKRAHHFSACPVECEAYSIRATWASLWWDNSSWLRPFQGHNSSHPFSGCVVDFTENIFRDRDTHVYVGHTKLAKRVRCIVIFCMLLPKFPFVKKSGWGADVRPGRHAHQFINPHDNSSTDLFAGSFGLIFLIRAVLFRKFQFK